MKAYVVLRPGHTGDAAMTRTLQDYVKASDRALQVSARGRIVSELPKTQTGKLQRFELRKTAAEQAHENSRRRDQDHGTEADTVRQTA